MNRKLIWTFSIGYTYFFYFWLNDARIYLLWGWRYFPRCWECHSYPALLSLVIRLTDILSARNSLLGPFISRVPDMVPAGRQKFILHASRIVDFGLKKTFRNIRSFKSPASATIQLNKITSISKHFLFHP